MKLLTQKRNALMLSAPVLAVLLSACGTTHAPPTAKIAAADSAIRQAEDNQARDFAALDLRYAQDKLQNAKAAVASGDDDRYPQAAQLADEATVDARLASEKARAARSEKLEADMQKSLDTLREETAR